MTNNIICKKVSTMLSLYIDNKVNEEEFAFINNHLENCENCRKKYQYLKYLINDLKASYKKIQEISKQKQEQHLFRIKEHETFVKNISPYIDNELEKQDIENFRNHLIKSQSAQNELKNVYSLQNKLKASYKKRAEKANNAITKNVISVLKNRTKHLKSKSTKNKSFKVAILTGLLILCGFETGELVKQNDKLNSIKTHSNSINIDKFSYTNIQNSIKQFVKSFQN